MKKINSNVACAGMDVHYKFSNVTFRNAGGKVVSRQRLDHPDRGQSFMNRMSKIVINFQPKAMARLVLSFELGAIFPPVFH